jgi:hypothetical protein
MEHDSELAERALADTLSQIVPWQQRLKEE